MNISVQGHGILADWLGSEPLKISLPDALTYRNVKTYLYDVLLRRLPEHIQKSTAEQFFGQLIVMVNGQPVSMELENTSMRDGDKINLFVMMAGG